MYGEILWKCKKHDLGLQLNSAGCSANDTSKTINLHTLKANDPGNATGRRTCT